MGGCCDYDKKETNLDDRNKKVNNMSRKGSKKKNKKSDQIELDNTLNDTTLNDTQTEIADLNKDYFSYSPKQYSDEELLNMDINEISIGFHPTKIPNNRGISFHPFFYLKLENEREIGLVIQYLKLKNEQLTKTHMYEGIEYLEKDFQMLEAELCELFRIIEEEFLMSKYLITYSISRMNMKLNNFFQKIIPNRNEWTQENFNIQNHACIHFCINALENLKLKGKKEKEKIQEYKNYIFNIINKERESKYYEQFKTEFDKLFKLL